MTDVGGATNSKQAQSRNMMKICTKYGFDILIISGSYGGHRQHRTDDGQHHRYGKSSPQVSYKNNKESHNSLSLILGYQVLTTNSFSVRFTGHSGHQTLNFCVFMFLIFLYFVLIYKISVST